MKLNRLSEKKRTAINLVAKTISYSTTLLISFFLTPFLVKNIGKEAYSFYPLANNFVNYMGVITVALNSMASRFITISLTRGEREKANTYFISILASNIFLSLVLVIPMAGIVIGLEYILEIPFDLVLSVKVLFSLVFISMIVNLLTSVFGVACFSQNRLELTSIEEIIIGILRIVLYVILFICFRPTVVMVGIVSLVVAVSTVLIEFSYTRKLLPFIQYKKAYCSFAAVKEVLSSGAWNSVNQIGNILLSMIGLFMCNKLYGAAEGGDYAIALTIPTFMNGIVSMLSAVFLPGLTIKYSRGNTNEVIKHVHMSQNVIGMIVNIPIAAFMAIGVSFFKLWTPTVDPYKLQSLSILAIGYLLVTSVMWPVSNLNTVMNKVKVPALVMLGTGFLNVLSIFGTYYFIDLGIWGIPLGQMILFILNRALFVGPYAASVAKVKWYTFYPALIRNLIGAVCIFCVSYVIDRVIAPQSWMTLIAECVLIGVIGIGINAVIVLKPLQIKNIISRFCSKNKK